MKLCPQVYDIIGCGGLSKILGSVLLKNPTYCYLPCASPVSPIDRGNKWLCIGPSNNQLLFLCVPADRPFSQTSLPTLVAFFSDVVFHSAAPSSPVGLTHLLGVSWEATALDLPRASDGQWSLPISLMAFTLQIPLGAFTLVPAVGSGCWCLQARSTMVQFKLWKRSQAHWQVSTSTVRYRSRSLNPVASCLGA